MSTYISVFAVAAIVAANDVVVVVVVVAFACCCCCCCLLVCMFFFFPFAKLVLFRFLAWFSSISNTINLYTCNFFFCTLVLKLSVTSSFT